jgi:hypothetical protein
MHYQMIVSPPTLRVLTSSSTPPGSYQITLTGSAKGVAHQAQALLAVEAVQPFDFSISCSPSAQTVTPGGGTQSAIAVGLLSGTSQSVALTVSGAPSGVSASLNPASGKPSFSSTLSITTAASVAPGQYSLTVTGTAGALSHQATFTLTVGQAPDFRINVTPASRTSAQGGTATYQVKVVGLNGFNSEVTLAVSGLPSGVTGVFTTPSGTPNFTSTLTVVVPADAATGSFTLTVTGTGGGVERTDGSVLKVNSAAAASTQTSIQTSSQTGGDLTSALQQNAVLILAAVILVVGVAIVAMMHKRQSGPTAGS